MIEDENLAEQMAAARKTMHQYRDALSALANGHEEASATLKTQMEIARERMKKYRMVYRVLAE